MNGRLVMLDGLRGLAAIVVVLFHMGLITQIGVAPAGYLAVDFFFILSGFVICQVYEPRLLGGLSLSQFLVQRAIRLSPIVALGAALGILYLCAGWAMTERSIGDLLAILITGGLNAFLIPKPPGLLGDDPALFPGNWALWSLFFEVLINIVWAVVLVGRSIRVLALFVLASAIALTMIGLASSSLNVGWTWPTFAGGLARVSFGFSMGCLLYRLRKSLPGALAGWSPFSIPLLIVALFAPLPGPLYELAVTLVILPVVVFLGSSPAAALLPGVSRVAGELSYALYGIHLPLIVIIGGLLRALAPDLMGSPWLYLITPGLMLVGWATAKFYEAPARAALSRLAGRI